MITLTVLVCSVLAHPKLHALCQGVSFKTVITATGLRAIKKICQIGSMSFISCQGARRGSNRTIRPIYTLEAWHTRPG